MFYGLKDFGSGAVLIVDQDPYVVNNLKSGALDCEVFCTGGFSSAINTLRTHSDNADSNTGIRFVGHGFGSVEEFSLENSPQLAKKQRLVRLRRVAFVKLLNQAQQYRNKNAPGFHASDALVINQALVDPNRIKEYADILGISEFFAQQELSMIVDTVLVDCFRLFTICNFWKKRINQAETQEQINNLLIKMSESFYSAGIADA